MAKTKEKKILGTQQTEGNRFKRVNKHWLVFIGRLLNYIYTERMKFLENSTLKASF